MTDRLLEKLIRNSTDVGDPQVRASCSLLAGICGIAVNLLLFSAKFLIGNLTGALSVTADAFNNLSDLAASLVTLFGSRIAMKPADADHPFGHGRMEYVAALAVAFLVLHVGFDLLKESAVRILNPEPLSFSAAALAALLLSILLKFLLSRLNRFLGNRIGSAPLEAAALDAGMDCVSTAATALGLLAYRFFHLNIDGIIGLLVSLLIFKCGIEIVTGTLEPLLGGSIDDSMNRKLKAFFFSFEGVLGCHDLIVHNYGPVNSYASVHIEVSDSMSINEAHVLLDGIERECFRKYGIHLMTHTDPVSLSDPKAVEARKTVEEAVAACRKEGIGCHDIRLVPAAGGRTNLVFDLVVPFSLSPAAVEEVRLRIRNEIAEKKPEYDTVMTVEHGFAGQGHGRQRENHGNE